MTTFNKRIFIIYSSLEKYMCYFSSSSITTCNT